MFALRPMDSLSAKCSQVEFAMRVILQWDFAASCIWFLLRFLVYVVPVASTEQLLGFFRTCPEGPTLRKQFFDHQEEGNDKKILLRVLPWKSHAQSIIGQVQDASLWLSLPRHANLQQSTACRIFQFRIPAPSPSASQTVYEDRACAWVSQSCANTC